MKVKIPCLPDRCLNPNWKGHWAVKAKAAKLLRQSAFIYALSACEGDRPEYEKAELSITFVIKDVRYIKDTDNAINSLKAAIDGCVDAGIIKDDSPKYLSYKMPINWQVNKDLAPMIILDFKEEK